MRISKKDFGMNVFFSFIYLILLIINLFMNNLISQMILIVVSYTVFVIYCKRKLKKFHLMLSSPAFIYASVFVPYVIFAIIVFVVNHYQPVIHYFLINTRSMTSTTTFYIYVYLITLILLTLFNQVKSFDIQEGLSECYKHIKGFFSTINVLDIVVIIFSIYNLYKIVSFGNFLSLTTLQKREITSSEISHYVNLIVMIYSLLITCYYTFKSQSSKKFMGIRLFFTLLYWVVYLTCERRILVTFLIGFIILFAAKLGKVKLRYILISLIAVCALLISASIRGNVTLDNHKPEDVVFMSLSEFYLTYTISNYYTEQMDYLDYEYGKTYTVTAFYSLFPSIIASNKPKGLANEFADKMNLNVGYSFNPIAEGILNFGKYAIISVPFLLLLIVIISNGFYKFNVLMPIIISMFSLDFYRGQFANFFFDSVYCFVFLFLIFKVSYRSNLRNKAVN